MVEEQSIDINSDMNPGQVVTLLKVVRLTKCASGGLIFDDEFPWPNRCAIKNSDLIARIKGRFPDRSIIKVKRRITNDPNSRKETIEFWVTLMDKGES